MDLNVELLQSTMNNGPGWLKRHLDQEIMKCLNLTPDDLENVAFEFRHCPTAKKFNDPLGLVFGLMPMDADETGLTVIYYRQKISDQPLSLEDDDKMLIDDHETHGRDDVIEYKASYSIGNGFKYLTLGVTGFFEDDSSKFHRQEEQYQKLSMKAIRWVTDYQLGCSKGISKTKNMK